MTDKQRSVGFGSVCTKTVYGILTVLILALSGCHQPHPQVDREQLRSMADPEVYLLALLDQRYENPDVHCELGRYYHSQHNDTKARYHYDTALGFDPTHCPTQAALIKMCLDQGKADQAQELMQQYQRQIINYPQQLVELGNALDAEDLDRYAFSCFQQALNLGPNLAPTNKYMGLYYLRNNDLDRAKQYLIKSFEINSNQPDVARHLGDLGVTVELQNDYSKGPSIKK